MPSDLLNIGLASKTVLLLLFAGGCTEATQSDSELYVEALRTEDNEQAAEVCAALTDVQLRGDCKTAVAHALAEAGSWDTAEALCRSVTADSWQDECWFSITDGAGLVGPEAFEACGRAGQYSARCNRHVLERAVAALDIPIGQEAAVALAEIAPLVRWLRPNLRPQPRQLEINRLLSQTISRRWATTPFDPALCGEIPEVMCRYAYTVSLAPLQGQALEVCAAASASGLVTSAMTTAVGMSGFTPAGAEIGQQVWGEICDEIAVGALDPYEVGAFVPPSLERELHDPFPRTERAGPPHALRPPPLP